MLDAESSIQPWTERRARPQASLSAGTARLAAREHRVLALHDAPGAREHVLVLLREVRVGRVAPRAVRHGVLAREFGTEEEDLRGVVHPHDRHHDGPGGPEGRGHRALAEVEPDEELADPEKHRRD